MALRSSGTDAQFLRNMHTATSFIEEKIKKDKIDIEKMQEIMDSLEETENIGTNDAIFKWIDNLDLEEEEKEIQ